MIDQDRDGIWWPSRDRHVRKVTPIEVQAIPSYVEFCPGRRTCIQAGGNVGLFPIALADYFDRVVTFEPHPVCFDAMTKNVGSSSRIEMHRAALWDYETAVRLFRIPKEELNLGASRATEGGDIPAVTIDSLNLDDVDLVMLDVEGSEHRALAGGQWTILRCRPILALELKGIAPDEDETRDMIRGWGYEKVGQIKRDEIWKFAS